MLKLKIFFFCFFFLTVTKFYSQTCLDLFLKELEDAKNLPEAKSLCYDEEAYLKFWKEAKKYSKNHSTYWKAEYCYKQSSYIGFKVAWFNFEYANFLVDCGRFEQAIELLKAIPKTDPLYQNSCLKIAEIMIWIGEYTRSSNVLNNVSSTPNTQIDESKKNLLRRCDSLMVPIIKQEFYYKLDNQPLSVWGHNVTFRKVKSKFINYQINYGNSFFLHDVSTIQTRFNVQNTFLLNPLKTSINLGFGGVMYGTQNVNRIFLLGVKTQLNPNIVNELKFESNVYDLTRGSVSSILLIDQLSDNLRYNRKSGFAFELFGSFSKLNKDNTSQHSIYSWFLSSYIAQGLIRPRLGAFAMYANSSEVLFSPLLTYDQIINSGSADQIEGVFSTWFTPNKVKAVGGILDFEYLPTKKLKFNSTNTIGIGSSNEPFLYLQGNKIELTTYRIIFVPVDLKFNTTYLLSRSIEAKFNYEYRITVFNKAHSFSFSIAKRLR